MFTIELMRMFLSLSLILVLISPLGLKATPKEISGVLLKGSPKSNAVNSLVDYKDESEEQDISFTDANGDIYFLNRLRVVIKFSATLGDVNSSFKKINAKIVSSKLGFSSVMIRIPNPGDFKALKNVAAKLKRFGAFDLAEPILIVKRPEGEVVPNSN
jgi:hypothetical protein